MRYPLLDERQGFWSHVVAKSDCVAFQPTAAYWRGRVVGGGLCLIVLYLFCIPQIEAPSPLGWCLLALAAAIIAKVLWSANMGPRQVLVYDRRVKQPPESNQPSRCLSANAISKIVIRENKGRSSDDAALAQIYLWLKGNDSPVLVYQAYLGKHQQVRSVARQLSERWTIGIVDELRRVKNSAMRDDLSGLVHFGGFVLIGAIAIVFGMYLAWKQAAVLQWPSTEAIVEEFDPRDRDHHGNPSGYAQPTVRVRYTVGGVDYIGNALSPSPFPYRSDRQLADDTAHIRPGKPTRCWYNPSSPSESYLVNGGITTGPVVSIACGTILIFLVLASARGLI